MDQYEGSAEIYVEGRLLAEASKCSVSITGGNNKVFTMRKGLAGKSDGPTTSEVTIESAVPRKGLEVDFRRHVISKKLFTVVVKSAGARIQIQGWFDDVKWDNAVDAATMISTTFVGGVPKLLGS